MTNHIQANETINAEVAKLADYVVKEYGVDRVKAFETISREAKTQGGWAESNTEQTNDA